MRTSRLVRAVASVCLLGGVALTACGDDTAPIGSTVSAPADATIAVSPSGVPPAFTLTFAVTDASGNPVPGVDLELFADASATSGQPAVALFDDGGTSLGTNGIVKTDERGLGRVTLVIGFDTNCAGADISATGIVGASVGVAGAQWTGTYTVKCT